MTTAVQLLNKNTVGGTFVFDFADMGLNSFYPGGNVEDCFFLLDGTIGTGTVAITFGHRKSTGTKSTGNPEVYTAFYNPPGGALTLSVLGWSAKVSLKWTALQIVYTAGGGSSFDLFIFN